MANIKKHYDYIDTSLKMKININNIFKNYITKMYNENFEKESVEFTKRNILIKAGDFLVAQSNIDQKKALALIFE